MELDYCIGYLNKPLVLHKKSTFEILLELLDTCYSTLPYPLFFCDGQHLFLPYSNLFRLSCSCTMDICLSLMLIVVIL